MAMNSVGAGNSMRVVLGGVLTSPPCAAFSAELADARLEDVDSVRHPSFVGKSP